MYSLDFSLTSLRSGDNVVTVQHGRDGVGLDGGWIVVSTSVNVFNHDRVKAGRFELGLVRDVNI